MHTTAYPADTFTVVDAANVMGSRPDGWWRDRAAAARRLVDDVTAALVPRLGTTGEAVVVLEGAARRGVPVCAEGGVRIVHAAGSGDDAIVAEVAAEIERRPDRRITVVTSDRGLRHRVEELGAQTHGPRWLWRRLEEPGDARQ